MATHKKTRAPIHLKDSDGDRQVVIETPYDRFLMSCVRAVEACASRQAWQDEFTALVDRLKEWVESSKGRVRACYLSPGDGHISVFFVPSSDTYDFDLGDALNDLEVELATNFKVVPTEVLQIPGDTSERLEAFVDVEKSITIKPAA